MGGSKLSLVVLTAMVATGVGNSWASARRGRTIFDEPHSSVPGPKIKYSGLRIKTDSMRVIYYHEQTIAVVEVGEARELHNCELLEVRTALDREVALRDLKKEIPVQIKISFPDMMDLMGRCQMLDLSLATASSRYSEEKKPTLKYPSPEDLATFFSGIFPGTKWCGAGNIATSYHDLGTDRELDKCCRTHDHCPVKVMAFRTQYNLTNLSFYTKSHCDCDDEFYKCLKSIGSTTANLVGNVFFNILKAWCVEDVPPEKVYKRFAWRYRLY